METKYKTKPLIIFIMIVFGLTYIFGGVLYFVNNKIILSNLIMLFLQYLQLLFDLFL